MEPVGVATISPSALNSVSTSPSTRVRRRMRRESSPRLKTASFKAIMRVSDFAAERTVTCKSVRSLNSMSPFAMHSTASLYPDEFEHVKKPSDPTLIPKIGLIASPSSPATLRIVPSPPKTTRRSASAPSCAIVKSERRPAIAAVSFSIKIDIEKRLSSSRTAWINSATPGFPVCAINPIFFGDI